MVALLGRAALLLLLCWPSVGQAATRDGGPAMPSARAAKAVTPARRGGPRGVVRRPPRNPPVQLFHVNTRETLKLRFADERGRPIRGWQKRFQRFMRCHHTNTLHRMDPRLPRLLYQVGRHYEGRRLEVVAGYRNPKVARNPKSPHKKGLACDFHVSGVSNAVLRDYLRQTFKHVGVGYYPNSSFVHLDVRTGKSAFWIDYSGPGQESEYSRSVQDDLKTGQADLRLPRSRSSGTDEGLDDLMETAVGAPARPQGGEVTESK